MHVTVRKEKSVSLANPLVTKSNKRLRDKVNHNPLSDQKVTEAMPRERVSKIWGFPLVKGATYTCPGRTDLWHHP